MVVSVYLFTPFCAWLIAQGIKYLLQHRKRPSVYHLYRSGGMPSAHAAVVSSLATAVGLQQGFDSAIFGVAAITALIVMYDAMNVRFSVGEQGELLVRMLAHNKQLSAKLAPPKVIRGHTLLEVIGGGILGVIIAVLILFFKNS
jgi:acid phosphatase family membrane protein YuiD